MKGNVMGDQLLYDVDGNAYRLERDIGCGEILAYQQVEWISYDGEESGVQDGPLLILKARGLFQKPPTRQFDEKIAALKDQEAALRKEVQGLRAAAAEAKKESDAVFAQITPIEKLERLRDFIDGKLTHYVVFTWNGPVILPFDESESEYSNGEFKLLTLFGKSNGDLTWKLNNYYDGSGGWNEVVPCCSHDEALLEVFQWLARHESEALDSSTRVEPSRHYIALAKRYGMEMSKEYVCSVETLEREAKQREIAKLEQKLAELKGQQ